ncbi:NERD domain-containing protein [Kurthia sibirica]|uniref:NERD domain-containing protein n=1 Tax=Kurthia sibirica TaxID=202750 RepID=A0A2U3AP80_9BACL|nr:NERD domain-containing protein [Kurthia sibirica]PWI26255.1 NERD domain-containing protein [Kurthia sibirica]GEK33870.1 hypothetical protein KSI01_14030 [Kurthia sibirica]
MAQLIKLQDYISRYEMDLKRYPTQFIRLKQTQWTRMKNEWESEEPFENTWQRDLDDEPLVDLSNKSLLQRFNPFKRKEKNDGLDELFEETAQHLQGEEPVKKTQQEEQPEEGGLLFEANMLYNPQNIEDLRRMYMDQLFNFQLKWASSTIREKSNIEPRYQRDELLKQLLQNLPDTFLVMYEPIILLKKAPVELGIIIISPTDCYCIQVIEAEERATFTGGSTERFWEKRVGERQKNVLNPMIALNRMDLVVKQLFQQKGVDMNSKKIVLCRNGYIDYPGSSFGVEFIDRRTYLQWLEQLKKHHSPMKHMQFKAAETLLVHGQTTSFMRAEWYGSEGEK